MTITAMLDQKYTLAKIEAAAAREAIVQTLRDVRGNQCEAARRLGVHRNTLDRRMDQLDINPKKIKRMCYTERDPKIPAAEIALAKYHTRHPEAV